MKVVRSRLKKMDDTALLFSSSLDHDSNIFYYVILTDLAHTLNIREYLGEDTIDILKAILEVRMNGFESLPNYEDVHEAVEASIIELAGDKGRKLQTGKSRNDEIATCLRLFARDRLLLLMDALLDLNATLLQLSKENDIIMPGYTHLQPAQPTRLSHHLLAYHDIFQRDFDRALQTYSRVNLCPLGAAAFNSTSFEIDRENAANLLGFDSALENTADAAASRDFLIETLFVSSSVMLSLSRLSEELILWSSDFNFVELPDEYASSSSIMPQKKNPDIAELIRAKTGKIIGNLTAATSIYKALPFNYNRDFQEMNPLLYESLQTAIVSVGLMAKMLEGVQFKVEEMEKKAGENFTTATELANLLVRKANVPFRKAHHIVGILASKENFNPTLNDLDNVSLEVTGNKVSELLDEEDLKSALDPKKLVNLMNNLGATSKEQIEKMLNKRETLLYLNEERFQQLIENTSRKLEKLYLEVNKVIEE